MKSSLRSEILIKLESLSADEKKSCSEQIETRLQQQLQNESGPWGAFKNLKNEPAIRWEHVSDKIQWVFPKIENDELQFLRTAGSFAKSALGFLEPADGESVPTAEVHGFVIPALAFDKRGYRLGRGKGFYDRALKNYAGKKIGICFDLSLCEEIPFDAHDIQCDEIITETRVYKVNRTEGERTWN